jgi:sensor histidine kinase YesM
MEYKKMKFFKLSLLVLPLFIFADNPILPSDIDVVQQTSTQENTIEEVVSEEPEKIISSNTEIKSTQSSYQQETPPDLVLFSWIMLILVL